LAGSGAAEGQVRSGRCQGSSSHCLCKGCNVCQYEYVLFNEVVFATDWLSPSTSRALLQ
jgi:hypothetical protein